MTFFEQVLATFIGALAAFVFSLVLFYLQEKFKEGKNGKTLMSNIKKECDFNVIFLEDFKDQFDKFLRKISANDKSAFLPLKFEKVQRLFISKAFNEGLLYDSLKAEELQELDSMLDYFSQSTNNFFWTRLQAFCSGKTDAAAALPGFEFDKEKIQKYINFQKLIKEKFKK